MIRPARRTAPERGCVRSTTRSRRATRHDCRLLNPPSIHESAAPLSPRRILFKLRQRGIHLVQWVGVGCPHIHLRVERARIISIQDRAKTFRPLPVSRNDFMLESTRGQPQETLPAIFEPSLNLSCVTVRQTMSSIRSISKVTRDLSLRSSFVIRPAREQPPGRGKKEFLIDKLSSLATILSIRRTSESVCELL